MTTDLSGRLVLVTGAGRGLGRSLVEAALDRNATTVYAGMRDPAAMPAFSDPSRVRVVPLDVTQPADVAASARECADVDVVVSNAGISCFGPVLGGDLDAMRDAMEVNHFGPLRLVQALGPNLRRPEAGVIFVLSVAAVALSRSSPGYSASKAAALMVALATREELADSGATVTVALPGFIDTEMSTPLAMPKASPRAVADRIWSAWLAGERTVWPDRFAELVRGVVGDSFTELLDEPRRVMTAVQATYAHDVQLPDLQDRRPD